MATPTSLKLRDVTSSEAFDHKVADTAVEAHLLYMFRGGLPVDISIIETVAFGCAASMLQGPELLEVIRANRDALEPIALEAWDRKDFKIIRDIGMFA